MLQTRALITVAAITIGMTGASLTVSATAQAAPSRGSATPTYSGDFPDPSVLAVAGTTYAYATQKPDPTGVSTDGWIHIQRISSTGRLGPWSAVSDALPVLPVWAVHGNTWAPSVAAFGSSYVLWYTTTVSTPNGNRQCLSVATAPGPGAPFIDLSTGPAVCQLDHGGSIDPNILITPAGAYLLWKSDDNALGQRTNLWAAPLDASGTHLSAPSYSHLLTMDASWQSPAMEGPTMVLSGTTWYLFYGANRWDSSSAGIGYATCTSPSGGCVDRSISGPWLTSKNGALGPAGPNVFRDSAGVTRLAYHAWNGCVGYANGCVRAMWTGSLTFARGKPVLGS